MTSAVRQPAVAGTFYPSDPAELSATIEEMLAEVPPRPARPPKAVIAPHAGYVYSGPVAAHAYAALAPARGAVKRIVLLGPAHRARVRGLALPGARAMRTPLGDVEVDAASVAAVHSMRCVCESEAAHAREHSLEVHLPFLQSTLGDGFTVVPFAVGDATAAEVVSVLEALWGEGETRVVVSSDLSHYLPYETAQAVDRSTAQAIERFEAIDTDQACGARPVNGLIALARSRRLSIERLDLRNSGDTAGTRREVVGYASFALHEGGAA